MKIRLKYVRAWVDRKTGITYARLRRRGHKEVTLPGLIGSPEFMAGYHAALRGDEPMAAATVARKVAGTVDAIVTEYLASSAFEQRVRSENSRKRQAATLRQFCRLEGVGTSSITMLDQKYIKRVIADAPTLNVANTWLIVVRQMTQWAVAKGMIELDPTAGVKVKLPKSDGHATWSEVQIAQFEAQWPLGTYERLLFALLLYTGQRCGDVRNLGPHSIINGEFPIRQQKTGVEVVVPVHPELAAAITAYNVVNIHNKTFLATKAGNVLDQSKLNEVFRKACDAAGLPDTCVPHGLRKAFCRRLAERGATPHQIAGLSGHLTLKEVERYTRAFDRRAAGKAGFALLGRAA